MTDNAFLRMGSVVARTGIPEHRLRAWERRYSAVEPRRTSGGQRVYSEEDVERIRLLRDAVDAGYAVARVAKLDTSALRNLVESDRAPAAEPASEDPEENPGPGGREGLSLEVRLAIRAVEDGTGNVLRGILLRSALRSSGLAFVEDFACPLLREIGDGWIRGALGAAEEHLASQVIREVLGDLVRSARPAVPAPEVVCTTPPEQRHEFGALLAAYVSCQAGWWPVYAGADLPLDEIVRLAAGNRAVAVSILHPESAEAVAEELASLRGQLPGGSPLYVGGHPEALEGARRVKGVQGLETLTAYFQTLDRETRGPEPA